MYELIQVGNRTYYVNCPAKIGVYLMENGGICLIDSGNDKEAAKKVKAIADGKGWRLDTIVNTHSNADHIGGNDYLQEKTGCCVIASPIEAPFIRYPYLEPSFLYGGYPAKVLKNKFLCAKPSTVMADGGMPDGLETFELKGHYFGMLGLRTSDDVCFIADSLFSSGTIEKYHVFFLYDVGAFLETLDMLEGMTARLFIPSHADATDDIRALTAANRAKVQEIIDLTLRICDGGIRFEELLKKVMDHYGLKLDWNQYVLVGSTLKSYLSYLYDAQRLSCAFDDNRLTWTAV